MEVPGIRFRGFVLFALGSYHGFSLAARHQVDGGNATFLRRQIVASAAEEHPRAGGAHAHGPTAGGTGDRGDHRLVAPHGGLGLGQFAREVTVEAVQYRLPVLLRLGDAVQLFFKPGGETVVHQFGESIVQPAGDDFPQLGGTESTGGHGDVAPVLDGADDRRVGAGAADPAFFQLLHQARFRIPGRRLGEMLGRVQLQQVQDIPHRQGGQDGVVLLGRGLDLEEAVEAEDPTAGGQFIAAGGDGDLGGVEFGGGHLAGDELAPDQIVEPAGVVFGVDGIRGGHQVGGPDRLMGLLGAILRLVDDGLFRQVALAETGFDQRPHRAQGLLADVHAVGTHVGDEPGLVQALGQGHGLFHREPQAGAGRGLEGAGDERGGGIGPGGLVFPLGDPVAGGGQIFHCHVRLGPDHRLEGLAALLHHLDAEGLLGAGRFSQVGVDLPVFLGIEGADLPLPLDDQAHRHALHPAGTQAPGDLAPQQGRGLETHHSVQEAPGLLGIDPVLIDNPGVLEGLEDRPLGDFTEDHPLEALGITADDFPQVPRNGLPLAVQVAGQIDGVGLGSSLSQLGHHLLLARNDFVAGLPAVVGIDAHPPDQGRLGLHGLLFRSGLGQGLARGLGRLAGLIGLGQPVCRILVLTPGGKVPDVAVAGFHDEILAEVLVDRLGLGGRFDDDQGFRHKEVLPGQHHR